MSEEDRFFHLPKKGKLPMSSSSSSEDTPTPWQPSDQEFAENQPMEQILEAEAQDGWPLEDLEAFRAQIRTERAKAACPIPKGMVFSRKTY